MSNAAADPADTFAANRAIGRVTLAVRRSAGVTQRSLVREEGSLRVRCPGPRTAELEAVIINTAGGMAGGDRFNLDVTVAPGARLVVTTAAAEKVYRTLAPDATIDVKLAVAKGGVALATVLVVPGDEKLAAAVRALGEKYRGEVGVSTWNDFAVVRFCARDGAALRHDLVEVFTAVRGARLPHLWSN